MKIVLISTFILLTTNTFSQATLQWKQDFGVDTSSVETVTKLLVDANENIIECGNFVSTLDINTIADFTVKFNPNGTMQWFTVHHGPVNIAEQLNDAVLDYQNNIICVGSYTNNAGNNDFMILKYSPSGALIFMDTIDGTAQLNDVASKVCVDGLANIYVSGSSESLPGQNQSRTLKLSPFGNILWDHVSPVVTTCNFMSIDNAGNITITGSHGNLAPYSFVIEQIDNAGNTLWSKHFQPDLASAGISVCNGGNGINYVAANIVYDPSSNDGDIWLMKFNQLGDTLWSRIVNVSDSFIDNVNCMKLLNDKLYLCGYAKAGNQNYLQNFLTAAIDTNGNQLWVDTINGATNKEDYANDLIIEPNTGQLIVIGTTRNLGAEFNWLLQGYDTAGARQFQIILDNGYADEGKNILTTANGYFVCNGTNTYTMGHQDATVISYTTLPLFIGGVNAENHISFYPQPFHQSLKLNCSLLNGSIQLQILNLNGQQVYQTTIDHQFQNLNLDVPAGTYLYVVYQNGLAITEGKLMKQ